jgi:hypothetical protein
MRTWISRPSSAGDIEGPIVRVRLTPARAFIGAHCVVAAGSLLPDLRPAARPAGPPVPAEERLPQLGDVARKSQRSKCQWLDVIRLVAASTRHSCRLARCGDRRRGADRGRRDLQAVRGEFTGTPRRRSPVANGRPSPSRRRPLGSSADRPAQRSVRAEVQLWMDVDESVDRSRPRERRRPAPPADRGLRRGGEQRDAVALLRCGQGGPRRRPESAYPRPEAAHGPGPGGEEIADRGRGRREARPGSAGTRDRARSTSRAAVR